MRSRGYNRKSVSGIIVSTETALGWQPNWKKSKQHEGHPQGRTAWAFSKLV